MLAARSAALIVGGFAFVFVATQALLPVGLTPSLVAATVTAVLVGLYSRAITNTIRERIIGQADDWKLQVKPENCWIPGRDFDRLRHILLGGGQAGSMREDQVKLVTRQHRIFVWVRVILPIVAALALFGAAVTYGNVHLRTSFHFNQYTYSSVTQPSTASGKANVTTVRQAVPGQRKVPVSTTIFWWIPVLAGGFCLLVATFFWMDWNYNFLIITEWYVYLVTMPPVWLPTWQASFPRMSYEEMNTAGNRNTFFGNLLGKMLGNGWGAVQLDSPSQRDERFNDIPNLPNHRQILQIIETLRRSYRQPVMLSRN